MTNYQHFSIAFAIVIIRVALQGNQEHNRMPNCISGTIRVITESQTLTRGIPLVIHTSTE